MAIHFTNLTPATIKKVNKTLNTLIYIFNGVWEMDLMPGYPLSMYTHYSFPFFPIKLFSTIAALENFRKNSAKISVIWLLWFNYVI